MATAPTLPFVPVEEFLATAYEPHCEYIDGVLVPKAMPDYLHSKLQKLLLLWLSEREKQLGIEGLCDLHTRITDTRFRLPDVLALTYRPSEGQYPDVQRPPLFTLEIVSKGEPWTELRDKVEDHLRIDVKTVIIADPYHRTVMVATKAERIREINPPLLVNIETPGGLLQIDFDYLFSNL
jgi:Uma2 family endonuclease